MGLFFLVIGSSYDNDLKAKNIYSSSNFLLVCHMSDIVPGKGGVLLNML